MKEKLRLLVLDDSDGTDNLDAIKIDMIAMAPLVLECPIAECKLGVSGAKYKTLELGEDNAMKMLEIHVQGNHAQSQVAAAAPRKNMRERQKIGKLLGWE